jgi:hypothetical protein
MTREEAKEILSAYRHGTDDEKEPLFSEALALARTDADLNAWLAESLAFDQAMRRDLARVNAPADLRHSILANRKVIRPAPWWNPRLGARPLAAAAAMVIAIGLTALWFGQTPATFTEFRREIADLSWGPTPHVEAKAANIKDVRDFLGAHGVSTNFVLPPMLAQLKVRGCTLMHWQGHRVPVLCFNSEGKHLHLVMVDRKLFPDSPTELPEIDQWQAWRTASWSKDEHSYVLTGLSTSAFVKKFRKDKRWDWGG